MTITNKRIRMNSRWRFWLGYVLSLFVFGVTIYFALGASKQADKSEESELQKLRNRNVYWERMANLATNLNNYRDLSQKQDLDSGDENKKSDLESKIENEIHLLKIEFERNIAAMDNPDKVLTGFVNYSGLIKALDKTIKENSENLKEKLKEHCELEKKELKNDFKDEINDLKDQIKMLQMQAQNKDK
ncbi:MAG: hypothetical protein ABI761_06565 [Saprospiraceae bacterium]